MQLTSVRRRSLLATVASLAAALSVTRRSFGAEPVAGDAGRGDARLSGETALRPPLGQAPATIDLKTLGAERQVASISRSGDTYRVTTVSGRTASFSEFDLRFKTDSSARGPTEGIPVLIPASTDRAFVVFASPREISSFIDRAASL
jgi:cytochrome c